MVIELADVLETINYLAKSIDVSMQEITDVAMVKKAKNGGFDKKYYLERTIKVKKMNYLDNIDNRLREYYKILSWDFPEFLNDYIFTKEMQHLKYISVTCGKIYSKMFNFGYPYTTLDHSIGVALIIWNFTADKKQTLAGLFHDIASPVFKHTVDIFNGDSEIQESTENKTSDIIRNSKEIMALLKRDEIRLEEIEDYHIYPIADNDTPKLSADRLEYSLSNALFANELCDIEEIKRFYKNIYVGINEEKEIELCFDDQNIADKFVELTSSLSILYRDNKTRFSMELLSDMLKWLVRNRLLTINDLYKLSEDDVIEIINKSKLKDIYAKWVNMKDVKISKCIPNNYYSVKCRVKIRYIDPLVNNKRVSNISEKARENIKNNFNYDMDNYIYSDLIKIKVLD